VGKDTFNKTKKGQSAIGTDAEIARTLNGTEQLKKALIQPPKAMFMRPVSFQLKGDPGEMDRKKVTPRRRGGGTGHEIKVMIRKWGRKV